MEKHSVGTWRPGMSDREYWMQFTEYEKWTRESFRGFQEQQEKERILKEAQEGLTEPGEYARPPNYDFKRLLKKDDEKYVTLKK